jgi:flavin reductase (DIM6/NTAB) family NADH-FMN oxidoreductase RutF
MSRLTTGVTVVTARSEAGHERPVRGHVLVIGEVERVELGDSATDPLVYIDRAFTSLAPANGRCHCVTELVTSRY